jgi:hypothetical protein
MWAFDIEGLEDLRTRLRSRLFRVDANGDPAQETQAGDDSAGSIASMLQQRQEEEKRLQKQDPHPSQKAGQQAWPR